jgi:pimeloyl-ACP methyl ester carboxylesterase
MPKYKRRYVSIYYEEHGSPNNPPLLLIAPGGLNSTIDLWGRMPINPVELFPDEFHVVAMDQRNAGRSRGPLPLEDPWGAYVEDQLGLMDHLRIDRFLVIGCCIGCSCILKMIERSPERVIAGILMQPIGIDETNPGYFGPRIYEQWGQELAAKRSDIRAEDVPVFGENMWSGDFVMSVPRELLPRITTPLLVLPGYDQAHPTGVGLEVARLLPNAELREQWKDAEAVPETIAHMRRFLNSHAQAGVS